MMGKKDRVEALEAAAESPETRAGKTISAAGTETAVTGRGGGTQPQEGPEQMELTFPPTENKKGQEAIIEAVLFTTGNSMELRRLAVVIGQSQAVARWTVERLMEQYRRSEGGMEITQLGGNYQMYTKPDYYENLIRIATTSKKQVLTEVVLKTLSIVAYKQPVTKMKIGKIRSVKLDYAVNRLVEYNLVYGVGRLDAPGRPALFATTEGSLRRFGVGSVQGLPDINLGQEAEIRAQVEEELQLKLEETGLSALEKMAAAKEEWGSEIPKYGLEGYNRVKRKR